MIRFKNHNNGFTLLEALLSMMIVGIVLTPLLTLFGIVMQRVNRSSQQLYAIVCAKQLLQEARQKQDPEAEVFTLDKKTDEYSMDIKYVLDKSVDQKSSLKDQVGLHPETITIAWTDQQGIQHKEMLVTHVYKEIEQKKQ